MMKEKTGTRLETNGVPRKLLQKVPATKKDNVDHTNHTIYTKTQLGLEMSGTMVATILLFSKPSCVIALAVRRDNAICMI